MRRTKIICTLGPASGSRESISALAHAGMNIARFNFSHGTQESQKALIDTVRAVNVEEGFSVALLMDTKGSEVRTGDVKEPIVVKAGDTVLFSYDDVPKAEFQVIRVNHPAFAKDAKNAEKILVDNGESIFMVTDITKGIVTARALTNASIGSRRHVNLPGVYLSLPALTEKDWQDIGMGADIGMDFAALSFIRTGKEVEEVRAFLNNRKSMMRIITKVETAQAVQDIDAIIAASDGIMVARGDLGAEIPFVHVPAVQDDIVVRCRRAGKPVIVATHMLESMIKNPLPTRAEVTDVAHAAITGADCTMLSGETANGLYPIRALEVMGEIVEETENRAAPAPVLLDPSAFESRYDALAQSAVAMAKELKNPAVIVFTRTGTLARTVSALRPPFPIFAFTENEALQRSLQLLYGVHSLLTPFQNDPEALVASAFALLRKQALAKKGDEIVVIIGSKVQKGMMSAVQLRTIS